MQEQDPLFGRRTGPPSPHPRERISWTSSIRLPGRALRYPPASSTSCSTPRAMRTDGTQERSLPSIRRACPSPPPRSGDPAPPDQGGGNRDDPALLLDGKGEALPWDDLIGPNRTGLP